MVCPSIYVIYFNDSDIDMNCVTTDMVYVTTHMVCFTTHMVMLLLTTTHMVCDTTHVVCVCNCEGEGLSRFDRCPGEDCTVRASHLSHSSTSA